MARHKLNQHLFKQFLAQGISERRARSLAKSDVTQWVRATAAQLGMRGLAKTTERYLPKGANRITEKTPFISKRQFQKKETGLSLERRAALIRSGEHVSGHAAKQTQRKSTIRRLLENVAGVTDYGDHRQIEAARERAGFSRSQFMHWRRTLRESANPFVKSGRKYEFRGPRSFTHSFINRESRVQSAEVSGDNLVAMQDYREDVRLAQRLNDSAPLKRYDRVEIYDDHGNRLSPSTDIDQINRVHLRMNKRERVRYDRKVDYIPDDIAAVA